MSAPSRLLKQPVVILDSNKRVVARREDLVYFVYWINKIK